MGAPRIDPLAPVLMTLAGIAYGKPSAIPGYLADDPLTAGDWQIVWMADEIAVPVNFAFIARSSASGAYAIAIRGTYPDPLSSAYWDDANQDSPIGPMQPWPAAPAEAQIAGGTWTGFQNVIALQGGGVSFAQAVAALPPGATVYVTGHSLGGTLAPVVALWMAEQAGGAIASVYAFAGMTPGNAGFAALFGARTPLSGRVWRYNNTLDTVGYGWDRVLATRDFYQPAPSGGLLVEAALVAMALRLVPYGYTAIGAEIALPGVLRPPAIGCELVAYVLETLHQHMPDTYLALLGAAPLPFAIGFGTIVADKADPRAATAIGGAQPVYYLL
jgi:hypothetical protein